MRRYELVVLVATALLLAACGGGSDGDDADEPTSVGSGVEVPATTTIAPTAPTTATPAAPTGTAPAVTSAGPVVANRADRDIEGWRLSVVVADKQTFGPDEPMTFELTFANVSDSTLHADSAQDLHFGIVDTSGEIVWTDQPCGGTAKDVPGEMHMALAIAPGESGRFVERYPTVDPAGEECRVPPGRYRVVGQLDWCPPESLQHYEGRGSLCDPAAIRPLRSDPLTIEITP